MGYGPSLIRNKCSKKTNKKGFIILNANENRIKFFLNKFVMKFFLFPISNPKSTKNNDKKIYIGISNGFEVTLSYNSLVDIGGLSLFK